jgi:hypothetical protein
MYQTFNAFDWCLVPAVCFKIPRYVPSLDQAQKQDGEEVPNEYIVKWFSEELQIWVDHQRKVVKFENHCGLHAHDLPSAKLIALHSSVAHILHHTKAGECFNSLFGKDNMTHLETSRFQPEDIHLRLVLAEMLGRSTADHAGE